MGIHINASLPIAFEMQFSRLLFPVLTPHAEGLSPSPPVPLLFLNSITLFFKNLILSYFWLSNDLLYCNPLKAYQVEIPDYLSFSLLANLVDI